MTTKDLKEHLKTTHSQLEFSRPCLSSSLLIDDSPEDDAADAGVDEVEGPAGGEEGRDESEDEEADEDSQQATLRKIIVQNIK